VRLKLYKGAAHVVGRKADVKYNLYSADIVTFEDDQGAYDQRDAEGFIPADGVYACWLHVEGERYGAAVSIGNNPTFGDVPEKTIEAHAIDAHLDLYGKVVELEFVAYIRPMNKFPSADALAEQMGRDELRIREILGLPRPPDARTRAPASPSAGR